MEQYRWIFTSYQQDDWVQSQALAEFTANNAASETTKCSTIILGIGMDHQMTFDEPAGNPQGSQEVSPDQVQTTMQQIHDHLHVEMRRSQAILESGANKK
jgi:hypothetical protein